MKGDRKAMIKFRTCLSLILLLSLLLGLLPAGAVAVEAQPKADTRAFPDNKQYVDIPIEVLDFRGDGFLFESTSTFSSPYSLADGSPTYSGMPRPGTEFPGETTNSDDYRIEGLIQSQLYEGSIVYTEQTVTYVATAMAAKSYIANIEGTSAMRNSDMNKAFAQKYNTITTMGDFQSTIAKAVPPENGGVLLWNDVQTYYDLSYYMLSSVWRETPRDDIISTETLDNGTTADICYNLPVPELNHLRLYYVENNLRGKSEYTYSSNYNSGYDMGYIYNTNTGTFSGDPTFRPLDGRGFESSAYFGTDTEGRTTNSAQNYGFTIHAYGGFVYSESSDLYFRFSGDDDVYFFINGELVRDIGGVHGKTSRELWLNEVAADLGLLDGQICTFDMFYAERHTTGINMELFTNIQLMDMDVITGKQQYDGNTGTKLVDGAAVNVGTPIIYGFSMLNRRTFPIKEMSFSDESLGVTLDGQNAILQNGTTIRDLQVIYQGYNRSAEELYSAEPYPAESFEDLKTYITGLVTQDVTDPMGNRAYSFKLDNIDQLKELLALGIPSGCSFTVKGFCRELGDGLYTNTVNSSCIPLTIQYNSDSEQTVIVEQTPIYGTASCRIYGIDLGAISVNEPLSYVIDYGHDIQWSLSEVNNTITYGEGMDLRYLGMTLNGEHGAVKPTAPINLFATSAVPGGSGKFGSYNLSEGIFTYSPTAFLNAVERSFAVYEILAGEEQTVLAYLMVEVRIIPATSVYYEAEDFTNEISLVQKDGTTINNTWQTIGDSDVLFQDSTIAGYEPEIPDYSEATDVLFFGFTNTENDKKRYTLPQYKGQNFDEVKNWDGGANKFVKTTHIKNGELIAEGQMHVTDYDKAKAVSFHPDCSDNGWMFSDKSRTTKALDFEASQAEVYQIRFKMKNLDTKYDENNKKTTPYLGLHLWCTNKNGGPFLNSNKVEDAARCITNMNIAPDFLTRDEYVTWTFLLENQFANVGTIWGVRTYFGNIFGNPDLDEPGLLTVDYIYLGPADKAPVPVSYGYDSGRKTGNENGLSNDKSLYTEGNGVRTDNNRDPDKYTEVQFSFTGTGFDLIGCTGPQQASTRIEIYTHESRSLESRIKTGSTQLKGTMDLYQIPIISIHDLDYGTYYVSVGINAKVTSPIDFLARGNQFYFDALRIYDPIDVSLGKDSLAGSDAAIAYAAYCKDREANEVITEIRDILIPANDFNPNSTKDHGVFVDYASVPKISVEPPLGTGQDMVVPGLDITDHVTYSIQTYNKVGPNNETYLGAQQLVLFNLLIYSEELPARIDIGAKALTSSPTVLSVKALHSGDRYASIYDTWIRSTNTQYYSLDLNPLMFTLTKDREQRPCYKTTLVITNKAPKSSDITESVLSVTDIKVAFQGTPVPLSDGTAVAQSFPGDTNSVYRSFRRGLGDQFWPVYDFDPVRFTLDEDLHAMVQTALRLMYTCVEHEPGEWVTVTPPGFGQRGLAQQSCALCGTLLGEKSIPAVAGFGFLGVSLSLYSDLSVNYKVDSRLFTVLGYSDPYVLIETEEGQTILRDYTEQDELYIFSYEGVAPYLIGDKINATLYATYEGQQVASAVKEYSIATYCYNMLPNCKGEQFESLRSLLIDTLHYGAMTQIYAQYKTDKLCNAKLTEEQLSWGNTLDREPVSVRDLEYGKIDTPTVSWAGVGLELRESIDMVFYLLADSYEGLSFEVRLGQEVYTYGEDALEFVSGVGILRFRELTAAELSEPVYITAYRDGVQVSHTARYSVESYVASMAQDSDPVLVQLVKAMLTYGDGAKAYLNSAE